jgi:hypothetical protein
MKRFLGIATALAALPAVVAPQGAQARDKDAAPPKIVTAIAECRAIADDAARLRCFDTAATDLAGAIDRRAVVVVDQEEIAEKRREQFGARRQDLGLPGVTDADAKIDRIEGKIRSASTLRDGNWAIVLEDGSAWHQTDGFTFARFPRPGDAVLVREAALGTFKMRIAGQNGIRVRRVR